MIKSGQCGLKMNDHMIRKLIAIPISFIGIGIIVLGVLIEGFAEMILSVGEEGSDKPGKRKKYLSQYSKIHKDE